MKLRVALILLNCYLIAGVTDVTWCHAVPQSPSEADSSAQITGKTSSADADSAPTPQTADDADERSNTLGVEFIKNLISDQRSIWSSPAHLRWADASWLFPLTAASAGFFATDRAVPPALSSDPAKLSRYVSVSNYGLYSMIGAGGAFYIWGKLTRDDHKRETGLLAGEAAINAFAVDTALKYTFGRQRPDVGQGGGDFFKGGVSFPSDHSAVAWSIASVIAHEYPGPATQIAVYGLATVVSASRVLGKQHFPSDVLVGGAIGWLIGREVYRRHHDTDLPGAGWDNPGEEGNRDRQHMGSPSVPVDSWIYPAIERLVGLHYITTSLMGLRPWTRLECARLVEEAGEMLQQDSSSNDEEAAKIQAQLEKEFGYEIGLLSGGHNLTANLESVYARAVSINGPALTDGYHFGQTISNDFGRPYGRGTNLQAGGAFDASAGPLTVYFRAEYQHAPGAPALPGTAIGAIATADLVSPVAVQSGPDPATNRPQLMDAYAGVNLNNWEIIVGRQTLMWGPSPDGALLWSNNAEPVDMVRIVNPEPTQLPSFLRFLGPIRIDQFFGRLGGHPYVPSPYEYGQKISMKPFSFLELGLARTVTVGGRGSGNALTASNLIHSLLGSTSSALNSVPGDAHSEMDWVFYVPKVKNYIVLYGDAYAEDDILPVENPARNPWHPGIFVTRFPGLPKLDLHIEGVSTEQPGLAGLVTYSGGPANKGQFNYWNFNYRDGYTNGGNLIGNSVGRDGQAIQGWLTYWISPQNNIRVLYKNSSVASEFMPGGGEWQDYSVSNEMHLQSGFYVKSQIQYEHISRYPVLFQGQQSNVTAIAEIGFLFGARKQK